MYRITFVSSLFSPDGADRMVSHATLQLALDFLMQANVLIMQSRLKKARPVPFLYSSGVRYQAEPRGVEDWRDCLEVLNRMHADCEDLAAYRAAELRVRNGVFARARFKFWQDPQNLEQRYHCVVQYGLPMGGFSTPPHAKEVALGVWEEDPSKVLGMKGSY